MKTPGEQILQMVILEMANWNWYNSYGWAVINGAADLWSQGNASMQSNVFVIGKTYRITFDAN